MATYAKSRELTIGPSGTALSVYHLVAHQNIDAEIQDISTFLGVLGIIIETAVFAPVWTAGTQGSSSITTEYSRVSKQIHYAGVITVGAGFSGINLDLTNPVNGAARNYFGQSRYFRTGVAEVIYPAFVENTHFYFWENNTGSRLSANNPATGTAWAVGDTIAWSVSYSIA